jgi:hypothetical protein
MWESIANLVPKKLVYFCTLRAQKHSLNSTDPEFIRDGKLAEAVVQHWFAVTFTGIEENKPVTY